MTYDEERIESIIKEHQQYIDETGRRMISLIGFSFTFLAIAMNAMASLAYKSNVPVIMFVIATCVLMAAVIVSIFSVNVQKDKHLTKGNRQDKKPNQAEDDDISDFRQQARCDDREDFINKLNSSKKKIEGVIPTSIILLRSERLVKLARVRVRTVYRVRVAKFLYIMALSVFSAAALVYFFMWLP